MLVFTEPIAQYRLPAPSAPKRAGQRGHLDRVADRRCRCRAPRRNRSPRVTPASAMAACITRACPATLGRGVTDLQRAVVVHRRAADDRPRCRRRAGASDSRLRTTTVAPSPNMLPRASRVEGPHMAVGRLHAAGGVDVAGLVGDADRHSPGERHVAVAGPQALHGEVGGDQGGGAEGLHRDAGAVQVEQVGDDRGQRVLLVAHGEFEMLTPSASSCSWIACKYVLRCVPPKTPTLPRLSSARA